MQIPGFLGPTYPSRSVRFQSDRTVNWFPELSPSPESKSILSLIGVPGTEKTFTIGSGPLRAARVCDGSLYIVSGKEIYRIRDNEVSDVLGTLSTDSGPVFMDFNGTSAAGIGGDQLAIVDGVSLYIYNVVSDVLSVVALGFNPSYVTYADGYFFVTRKDSMVACASDPYNGLVWNGLATSPISAIPGNLKGCVTQNQEVWFIKEYTSEVWYDAGVATATGFPFTRVPGAVLNYGTSAPSSIVVGDNCIFMVGNARTMGGGQFVGILSFSGFTATVISTPSINYQISKMSTISDAVSFMFSTEGHTFLVVTFPTANHTFIYDTTTQMWHERSTYTANPYVVGKWNAGLYVYFDNVHYIGDMINGNLYRMDSDLTLEDGKPIVSIRVTPTLFDPASLDNLFVDRLELDFDPGQGVVIPESLYKTSIITATAGNLSSATTLTAVPPDLLTLVESPVASLSWSNDGGYTFGKEHLAQMGKRGEYGKRLVWRQLGPSSNRVWRLVVSSPVKKVMLGAYAEVGY